MSTFAGVLPRSLRSTLYHQAKFLFYCRLMGFPMVLLLTSSAIMRTRSKTTNNGLQPGIAYPI
jgi:hypothetical protein